MRFNREQLFKSYENLYRLYLGRKFTPETRDAIDSLFFLIEADDKWTNIKQLASFLAQTGHETGWTYKPVKENRASKTTQPKVWAKQEKYWSSGFYGRGLIQVTWKTNYEKFSKILGVDLVADPDKALQPTNSYIIASVGMRDGLFTKFKLSDFITDTKCDYAGARKIVNGIDRARDIENYSKNIENILVKSLVEDDEPVYDEQTALDVEEATPITASYGTTPDATPVVIESNIAPKMNGWSTWKTTLTGLWTSAGVSIGTIATYASDVVKNDLFKKYLPLLLIVAVAGAALFGVTYLVIRAVTNLHNEKLAHEKTLLEMEIHANPAKYNVVVKKN